MQLRNLSPLTQRSYVHHASLFACHFGKSPERLGPEEIRSYQVYLTNEKKLAPNTILIAVAALRFLYSVTLHRDWTVEQILPAPKRPKVLLAAKTYANDPLEAALSDCFCTGRVPKLVLAKTCRRCKAVERHSTTSSGEQGVYSTPSLSR